MHLCLCVESQEEAIIIEVSAKVRDSRSQRGGVHARAKEAGVRR